MTKEKNPFNKLIKPLWCNHDITWNPWRKRRFMKLRKGETKSKKICLMSSHIDYESLTVKLEFEVHKVGVVE